MVLSSVASEKIFQRKDLRMSVVESLEYALSNISSCELDYWIVEGRFAMAGFKKD